MHWRRQLIYFSTSRDRVHRIAFNATGRRRPRPADQRSGSGRRRARAPGVTGGAPEVLYQAGSERSGGTGLQLSVDWLYDRLYVADESTASIRRTCPFPWRPLMCARVYSHLLHVANDLLSVANRAVCRTYCLHNSLFCCRFSVTSSVF